MTGSSAEHVYALLKEMCDFDCLKERKTPATLETFSTRPEAHANKAKHRRAALDASQDPLEHTLVLRLVGVLLCVSLSTRPDISWAVARITRPATSDEA